MKLIALAGVIFLLAALAVGAQALTTDEVIRLKKAGVSDETIQKMLEQERSGGLQRGPVTETKDKITYKAGNPARVQRKKRHERWKEEKAMDAVGNVVIDARQYQRPDGKEPSPAPEIK